MEKQRMRYPAQTPTETGRQRDHRLALQASVAREAEHARQFGERPPAAPEAPVAIVKPSGELIMPYAAFRAGDYGQVCQLLGLRPSMPKANAQKARKRRRGS